MKLGFQVSQSGHARGARLAEGAKCRPGHERVLGRGAVGATAGTGLGFTGTAVIDAIAPRLSGSVATPTGTRIPRLGRPVTTVVASQTAAVPMSVQVSPSAVAVGVIPALTGGQLAGSFASWRIARLRPAEALARIG